MKKKRPSEKWVDFKNIPEWEKGVRELEVCVER